LSAARYRVRPPAEPVLLLIGALVAVLCVVGAERETAIAPELPVEVDCGVE
jgi:hypothetical protein